MTGVNCLRYEVNENASARASIRVHGYTYQFSCSLGVYSSGELAVFVFCCPHGWGVFLLHALFLVHEIGRRSIFAFCDVTGTYVLRCVVRGFVGNFVFHVRFSVAFSVSVFCIRCGRVIHLFLCFVGRLSSYCVIKGGHGVDYLHVTSCD